MSNGAKRGLAAAAVLFMMATAASRVLGLVREQVMLYYLGQYSITCSRTRPKTREAAVAIMNRTAAAARPRLAPLLIALRYAKLHRPIREGNAQQPRR